AVALAMREVAADGGLGAVPKVDAISGVMLAARRAAHVIAEHAAGFGFGEIDAEMAVAQAVALHGHAVGALDAYSGAVFQAADAAVARLKAADGDIGSGDGEDFVFVFSVKHGEADAFQNQGFLHPQVPLAVMA